jgi:hypothetical protein
MPKGCALIPHAIAAQLDITAGFTEPGSQETLASWLTLPLATIQLASG